MAHSHRKPRGFTKLTTQQREELRSAYSSLHWPLREEGPEIRLVVIAENVVARIISDLSWTHPMLDGHRSVFGFTIELHMIAAAAHELLRLRSTTPTLPADDGTDQLAKARAEWDRRHVAAARVEAALVDRVVALRAYEQALAPIGVALNNLQSVTELAPGAADVDRIFGQIIGSDYAAGHTNACETTSTTCAPVSTPKSPTSTVSSAHTATPEHRTKRTAHKRSAATPLRDALPSKGFWLCQSVVGRWLR
ncbi:hypothetical protein [Rhodococcus sp. NPDC055024]